MQTEPIRETLLRAPVGRKIHKPTKLGGGGGVKQTRSNRETRTVKYLLFLSYMQWAVVNTHSGWIIVPPQNWSSFSPKFRITFTKNGLFGLLCPPMIKETTEDFSPMFFEFIGVISIEWHIVSKIWIWIKNNQCFKTILVIYFVRTNKFDQHIINLIQKSKYCCPCFNDVNALVLSCR